MKRMKIVIFIQMQPAQVKSTSRMKCMTETRVQVIESPNVMFTIRQPARAKSIFSMVAREAT